MVAESLSVKTDLIFWRHHGIVIDRGEYLVIQTPRIPTWRDGHLIVFAHAPTPDDVALWSKTFATEFENSPHMSPVFTWDRGDLSSETAAALSAIGCDIQKLDVMVLAHLQEPRVRSHEIRAVENDSEWEAVASVSTRTFADTSTTYREFLSLRYRQYRDLAESGAGKFFAAFEDGRIVGAAGIYCDRDLYRFQEVVVLQEYRNRGFGGALIVRGVKYACTLSDDPTIVLCAAHEGNASRLYSSLGFERRETAYSMVLKAGK